MGARLKNQKGQNMPGFKTTINQNKIEAAVGRKLGKLYPGYAWDVDCQFDQGVVIVKNLTVNGDYGFIITFKELMSDYDLTLVKNFGGELLERCGLPATLRPEDLNQYVTRDLRDNVEMDTHGAS